MLDRRRRILVEEESAKPKTHSQMIKEIKLTSKSKIL
jgi:hypothetical protein